MFAKSLPLRLLIRHLAPLLYGQLYYFVAYRRPLQSLAGYAAFVRRIPWALGERRRIARGRRLPLEAFDRLLTTGSSEPSLRELFRRRFGGGET